MSFASDNTAAVAPEILAALSAANQDTIAPAYGADRWTAALHETLRDIFECDLAVFPVATGTAANCLSLSGAVVPWGAVYCHPLAHIQEDENSAPEFFTGGARLLPLGGGDGRIDPLVLEAALSEAGQGVVHRVQPQALSLTNATECGTVYDPGQVSALAHIAHRHGLCVHMDGARFANALAYLGCRPSELSWRAGVDVLSFGMTKNGAMAAEAVILFHPDGPAAASFGYRRKRAGHLVSKMRYLSAQLLAGLEEGRWLRWASHANAQAKRLADGLAQVPGAELVFPVEANEVFVRLPSVVRDALRAAGFDFYDWPGLVDGIRLVTAWNTEPAEVDRFLATAANAG